MKTINSGCGIVVVDGIQCEVNMEVLPPDVEGAGQHAAYPACLVSHLPETNDAKIYLMHDKSMRVLTVSKFHVAKPMLPLPHEVYPLGSFVEVQTRVSDTDEYGWWSAIVKNYCPKLRQYQVRWYGTQQYATVDKVHIRRASFIKKIN